MQHTPIQKRLTRRDLVVAGSGIATCLLAGCQDQSTDQVGASNDTTPSENRFRSFAIATNAVAEPWRKSAAEVTQEMVDSIVGELDDLLRVSIKGTFTSTFKQIIESTQTAFKQLLNGKRAFAMSMVRAKATEAVTGNFELPSYYPEGYSYSSSKPFEPLFDAMNEAFASVANEDSEETRGQLVATAEDVHTVFVTDYQDQLGQVRNQPGAKPLVNSLFFLHESAKWVRDNL